MSIQAVRNSHIPLYEQIDRSIRERISGGNLPPLSQVESETELARSFGVSRMTARKAIEALVREGLLFRRQGKGTFVSDYRIPYKLSTQLSFSTSMAAAGHLISTDVIEHGLVNATQTVAQALGVSVGSSVVHVMRLRSVDGTPAALHESWLPGSFTDLLETDMSQSLNQAMTARGTEVIATRDRVEAVSSTPDTSALLESASGAPLIRVSGVGLGGAGEALRYTEALYRGDRFWFTLDSKVAGDVNLEVKTEPGIA